MTTLHPMFLAEGAQSARDVAHALARFCAEARKTLHIAIYNVRLEPAIASILGAVLLERARAGVDVRIVHDESEPDDGVLRRGDVKLPSTRTRIVELLAGQSWRVQIRGVRGSALMHDKFVVRDAGGRGAAVWTGSANFTTDAWTGQENNIVIVHSNDVASSYEDAFEDLWRTQRIAGTGADAQGRMSVSGRLVEVLFSPGGRGDAIAQKIAQVVEGARRRVLIASMVVSSRVILEALLHARRRVTVAGIVDGASMRNVIRSLGAAGDDRAGMTKSLMRSLVAKRSTPYDPTHPDAPLNFMHNKVVVADDLVVTGSYNFSKHAGMNAENVLVIDDAGFATLYANYIRALIRREARMTLARAARATWSR